MIVMIVSEKVFFLIWYIIDDENMILFIFIIFFLNFFIILKIREIEFLKNKYVLIIVDNKINISVLIEL